MKCNVSFDNGLKEPHANNLIKIESNRYLLDVTNPSFISNSNTRNVYIRKLPEGPINLNTNNYVWNFDNGRRSYET